MSGGEYTSLGVLSLTSRLALSYNALDDGAIIKSFSTLTRLRYLNLKGNLLTQFPEAVSLLRRSRIQLTGSSLIWKV